MDMVARARITRSSGNIFRDLGFSAPEAENLRLRSQLLRRIDDSYRRSGLSPAKAALKFGLTRNRFAALIMGRIGAFTLDALVIVAVRAGFKIRLEIRS